MMKPLSVLVFAKETKYNDYKDYYKRIEKKGSNVFLIDGGGEISRDENGNNNNNSTNNYLSHKYQLTAIIRYLDEHVLEDKQILEFTIRNQTDHNEYKNIIELLRYAVAMTEKIQI